MRSVRDILARLIGIRGRSEFFRNVAITFSGTALASLGSLLLTPVVTWLFDPDDFGRVAFLIALTVNLGLIATMGFPQALVLPRSRTVFYHLMQLCGSLLVLATVSVTLLVLFFGNTLLAIFHMEQIGNWLWILPLFLILNELNRLAVSWNVRRKRFRANAAAGVANNLSLRAVQIGYATAWQASLSGLLSGNLVAYILRLGILWRGQWRELRRLFFRIRPAALRQTARTYRNYPRWMLPAALIEALSASIPIYVLALSYDAAIVGHFAFAQSLLNHPYTMLSASVTPVFLQRANELRTEGLAALQHFALGIFRRLTWLGALVFGAAVFFSDWLLPLIFGSKWALSGLFAGSMAIYFAFRFISVPLQPLYRVLRRESWHFLGSGSIFTLRIFALLVGIRFFRPEITVLLFSVAGAAACLFNMLLIFRLLKMPVLRILLRALLIFAAATVFYGLLRWGLQVVGDL